MNPSPHPHPPPDRGSPPSPEVTHLSAPCVYSSVSKYYAAQDKPALPAEALCRGWGRAGGGWGTSPCGAGGGRSWDGGHPRRAGRSQLWLAQRTPAGRGCDPWPRVSTPTSTGMGTTESPRRRGAQSQGGIGKSPATPGRAKLASGGVTAMGSWWLGARRACPRGLHVPPTDHLSPHRRQRWLHSAGTRGPLARQATQVPRPVAAPPNTLRLPQRCTPGASHPTFLPQMRDPDLVQIKGPLARNLQSARKDGGPF